MLKVLHISKYYSPFIGGTEQVARDCVNSIRKTCQQKVICFNHEKGDKIDYVDDVEIIRVGCFAKIASQSLSLHYGKKLKKVICDFSPDIIIFHYPNPFVASILLKCIKNTKAKLFLWWHLDITKQKVLKLFFEGQNKKLLNKATKVIATSPNYIEGSKYLSSVKEKCIVIPNCVNTSRLEYSSVDIENSSEIKKEYLNRKILFSFGRHVEYKGIEYLIRASKFLSNEYIVLIGGKGPLTDKLKKLAANDDKVKFLGKISDNELKAYLLACDIFCFPSITKNEAFGIGLAEAMFYGKPTVTFNIPGSGVNYVSLNNLTCTEVKNKDYKAYAEAIIELSRDSNKMREYGENAKERVKMFSYELFQENVQKLFIKEK